ncbi:MAG TPA: DUF4249 family protein [Mucilaginibacter sp.]|jgi:hypothetical protein|nr:DUF4249 family protein [Mucilaginibacter sp.]
MHHIRIYCCIALSNLLLTLSCKNYVVTPQFKHNNKTYDIAVEGGINTFQTTQFIRLSKPAILPNKDVEPVSQAIVSISDGINKVFLRETSTPGIYTGTINNNTNYDRPYTLNVTYGKSDYAATDTLRRVPEINVNDLPFTAKKLVDGKIQLKIPRHIFGTSFSARWLITSPGKERWSPASLNKKLDYNYSHQYGSPNTLYPSTQKISTRTLNPGDTVTVYKFSLSASYSKYLYTVFQETDFKNIFSSVPGKIYGNVSNNALGYFYCTDVKVKRYLARDLVR